MKVQITPMEPSVADPRSFVPDSLVAEQQATALAQLQGFWHALEYAFQERLSELAESLSRRFGELLEAERLAARAAARRELSVALQQAARRLRMADNFELWASALVDAAKIFSRRAAVLAVEGDMVAGVASRGFEAQAADRLAALRVPLGSVPAIAAAVQTGETVMAQRSCGELSEVLAGVLGEATQGCACLAPVVAPWGRLAVLYADAEESTPDAVGLELVAEMAAAWPAAPPAPAAEVSLQTRIREPRAAPRRPPEWSELSRQEQELHLRAQRFARVQAAEMRLYKAEALARGRAGRNVYSMLKPEIDAARAAFREQFLNASPTMVDYLHQELVRTLAHEDPALLGEDYPGALV